MAYLVIQSGKHRGRKIVIPQKESLIGRDEGCFIRLFSSEISRRHCLLMSTPHGIVVRDLGSSNGTFVNDQAVSGEVVLQPGDHLRVGPAEFSVPGQKPEKPAPAIDDDIAEWLTEGESSDHPLEMDTTIVKGVSDVHSVLATAPKPAPKPRKEFHTVAEEAQDIIRRHYEWLATQEAE